jgi:hypothetical protein
MFSEQYCSLSRLLNQDSGIWGPYFYLCPKPGRIMVAFVNQERLWRVLSNPKT